MRGLYSGFRGSLRSLKKKGPRRKQIMEKKGRTETFFWGRAEVEKRGRTHSCRSCVEFRKKQLTKGKTGRGEDCWRVLLGRRIL